MYIIIVGAGPIGAALAELALDEQHNVVLIEPEEARARKVLRQYDVQVFHADVSEEGILEEANVRRADALIATSEDDKTNLMAVALAREHGVETLISTVNTRGHEAVFERLGVTILKDPRTVVAEHLFGFLRYPEYEGIVPLVGGKHAFKLTVSKEAPLVGKRIAEVANGKTLPEGLLVVLLQRDGEVLVPGGETVLEAGDRLTLLADEPIADKDLAAFTG